MDQRIPLPAADKPPLKTNVFQHMRGANCQLLPLFPYLDEGAMVPAGAIMSSKLGPEVGHFFHTNSVDEVVVVFGSQSSQTATGQVYATARTHGLGRPPKDPGDANAFALSVITQRQAVGQEQKESIAFRCHKCNEVLLEWEYDAAPAALRDSADAAYYPALSTLEGSSEAAQRFNRECRACSNCGAEQPRFPEEVWGWSRFVAQNQAAQQARQALIAAAEEG